MGQRCGPLEVLDVALQQASHEELAHPGMIIACTSVSALIRRFFGRGACKLTSWPSLPRCTPSTLRPSATANQVLVTLTRRFGAASVC